MSLIIAALCLSGAFYWGSLTGGVSGGVTGAVIALILGVLEVSLSFDNAVVNASILKNMDDRWQQYFLTWGILVAVFGMRLIFPITIVQFAAGVDFIDVVDMALHDTTKYATHLTNAHTQIAAFGGMFLMMVFFGFIFDNKRELHWLGKVERKLAGFGKLESVEIITAFTILLITQHYIIEAERLTVMIAGVLGIVLFVVVSSLASFFEDAEQGAAIGSVVKRAGVMSFIYLEILDASFSFDGVIGAFAITQDVVIIMLGLAIGAMFVRSLTIFLVRKGTLDEFVYLEHGAHYAIGALAGIMLISMHYEVPEVVTGLIGATFIGLSVMSSISYKCE